MNTGVILIMFILLGFGITMLVFGYDKTDKLNDVYVKAFQKDPPPNFIKIFLGIGWGLSSIALLVIGILFYLEFKPKSVKQPVKQKSNKN